MSETVKLVERKPRERLLDAAASLLAAEGASVSTRAICDAAGVTAPTLYHYFGDREGLLSAVVSHGFGTYLAGKRSLESTGDAARDLRLGWDNHIAWGTANPAFYLLMYGRGQHIPAADEATDLLKIKLEAAARAGILAVPVNVGVRMIMSGNVGLTLQLISNPDAAADGLSDRVRDALFAAILVPSPSAGSSAPAVASSAAAANVLAASLDEHSPLGAAETALFREWLGRVASA
jgi:AcrR family transcriptional regulator